MTAADWNAVESVWLVRERLSFAVDGYRVTLARTILRGGHLAYLVYVNGELNPAWITTACAERRRFYAPGKAFVYSARERADRGLIKKYGRKRLAAQYTTYTPWWRSFAAFRRHLCKQNVCITIIQVSAPSQWPDTSPQRSKMKYLANTFSPMMVAAGHQFTGRPISLAQARALSADAESIVSHEVTAAILAALLGLPVTFNRASVALGAGDQVVSLIPNFRAEKAREFSFAEVAAAGFAAFLVEITVDPRPADEQWSPPPDGGHCANQ